MRQQRKSLHMVELNDLILIHENALEDSICDSLIQIYEDLKFLGQHEKINNDYKPSFTQFNLTANHQHDDRVKQIHNHIIRKTIEYRNTYYDFVDSRVFPDTHAFEQFRIKKYEPDEDRFDTHVDVQDYSSARRFLAYLWYLNDVPKGGETVFDELTIKPKQGTLLMFPPLWMFPHKGNSPIETPKYILTTYLHYK